MSASQETRSYAQAIVLPGGGDRQLRSLLSCVLDAMDAKEHLAFTDRGHCGSWDVKVFPADTQVKGDSAIYLATDRGLWVGFMEKTGFLSTQPSCKIYGHDQIAGWSVNTTRHPDGSELHRASIRNAAGRDLVALQFLYVAGFGFENKTRERMAALQAALGLA